MANITAGSSTQANIMIQAKLLAPTCDGRIRGILNFTFSSVQFSSWHVLFYLFNNYIQSLVHGLGSPEQEVVLLVATLRVRVHDVDAIRGGDLRLVFLRSVVRPPAVVACGWQYTGASTLRGSCRLRAAIPHCFMIILFSQACHRTFLYLTHGSTDSFILINIFKSGSTKASLPRCPRMPTTRWVQVLGLTPKKKHPNR